jgi:hypothetical protein
MKTTRREKSNCKTIENDSNLPAQTWTIDKLNKCEKIKILRFATRTGVTSCGSNGCTVYSTPEHIATVLQTNVVAILIGMIVRLYILNSWSFHYFNIHWNILVHTISFIVLSNCDTNINMDSTLI